MDIDSMYSGTTRKRVLGMIGVKTLAIRVIEHQARSQDDVQLKALQGELNRAYDEFVAVNGYLSTSANSRLMRSDPDWPVMLALEIWDGDEEKARKADIFFRRTVGHRQVPEKVDCVKDGMLISLSLYGQIVLKDLALRTGLPVMQVVKELSGQALAYRDPQLAKWVPAEEYLSGHIRDKIAAARAAGPAYAGNIPALEAVLPKDLGPAEVEARLGAPWIPTNVIGTFASELVNDTNGAITVAYEASSASWSVKSSCWRLENVGEWVLQTNKWGTNKRCALVLLEAALNQQPPTITVEVDGKRVVDKMATLNARDKWQSIRDEFRNWVYRDFARRDQLLRIYNDQFNQIVERRYDGSHLHLQGMSSVVTPYGHQKDAIWRIVSSGNTLLGHCVGAGKTLVMAAASMELRRLGKAVKPVHVVPNNCLEQYVAEFVRLYPQARVLMAGKGDLHGDKRRTFAARIATGDWDAIVMTHATFERLPLSPDVQRRFIDKMLNEARTAAGLASDSGAKRSLKEIEKRMKECEAKLERIVADSKKDSDSVWFDELGIDWAFIDESHLFKNLGRISKMPRMAGLPNVASQRAFDVFMKTRVLMAARGDREEGVVMATATPISNSLSELHVMQVYLQPQTLKKLGLYEFDAWSASFGESVNPSLAFNPNGKLAQVAGNVFRIWQEGAAQRVTQLVFCDIGTPGGAGFKVYAEVKRLLLENGIPECEIEFIQDHDSDTAKAKLFKRVREGVVRILFGSTSKMGVGTNVQTLLKAVHQIDGPWRPSDVEQRDGRGDRQGNLNESIELWRYVTEKSFDAYTWNLLDVKARFIEQVMTADAGMRSMEDISMSALSYAEIKAIASGNALVLEKATVDMEVQKLTLKRSHWEDDRWKLSRREADLVSRMNWIDKNMPAIVSDVKLAELITETTEFVPGTGIAQKAVDAVGNGAVGMAAAFRAHSNHGSLQWSPINIGEFGGFHVKALKVYSEASIYVVGPNSREELRVERPSMNDPKGVGLAVLKEIERFKTLPAALRSEYGHKANELTTTRQLLTQEFEHLGQLEQLLQRQREIESELDLDKDAEGTQNMSSEVV